MGTAIVIFLVVLVLVGAFVLLKDKILPGKGAEGDAPASPAGGSKSEERPGPGPAEDPNAPKVNWLIGKAGEHKGKTFHIGYRTVTIGREPTNFIQITEEKASRKHCQITPREGFLQVVDMKSQNGTFINGTPITQGRMSPGDELRVCSSSFVYARSAKFEENEALARKKAGPNMVKETFAEEGAGLEMLVRGALKSSQGDVDAAARTLGVPVTMVKSIIEAKGIDPYDP